MHVVLFLVGALTGALLQQGLWGFCLGGAVGYVLSLLFEQRRDLDRLKHEVAALAGRDQAAPDSAGVTPPEPVMPERLAEREAPLAFESREPRRAVDEASGVPPEAVDAGAAGEPIGPPAPSEFEKLMGRIGGLARRFFTTGNLVVRVGAVVLFFGVAFLLRYAYDHALIPVELRLAGAALLGLVLTVVGWRLRGRSDTYGLILQGVGVGILYLTIFAAARLYELLPLTAALLMLIALVVGSCVLAVLQKSQALAICATGGGFLAPVLMSTGAGSHVALFSYYALLNGGILFMAWFQFWRWLNWVGFVFTFAIGALWGFEYYRPEHFATTQPFLVLFFLYYLGVSVLFARRREVELKGLVDGTLVFGTPIIAFALQAALVADMEFGLAFSALGAAATYTLLAVWLKRHEVFAALLGESFVALGVVFATLAIPFAFDNQRFTAASWAVEGAGLIWVGLRQRQRLPRAFGLLLQVAAAAAFIAEVGSPVEPALFLNSAFLGAALLSLGAGFSAYLLCRHRDGLHRFEAPVRWFLLWWSVVWWFGGGIREIERYRPSGYAQFSVSNLNENLFVLFAAGSFAALIWCARRFRWREGLLPAFLLLPMACLTVLWQDVYWQRGTMLADLGWLAWPGALLVIVWHLRVTPDVREFNGVWHAGWWWLATGLVAWNTAAVLHGSLPESIWSEVAWGAVPLLAVALMLRLRGISAWPFDRYPQSFFGLGWAAMLLYLMIWLLVAGTEAADPRPVPYLVLINPLELVQLAVLIVAATWLRTLPGTALADAQQPLRVVLGVVGFLWINLVAARAVHFYAGVPYPIERLVNADAFQTTASILWTVIALVLMGVGTRRGLRFSWLAGAALLGLVIVKLFTVDLSKLDMVARIVSFLSVGMLMLVIGYFAPLPPGRSEEPES